MKKLLISVALLSLLAACSSNKTKAPIEDSMPSGAKSSSATSQIDAPSRTTVDPLNDSTSILAKRSVYYPTDVDTVQNSDKRVVRAHARYLSEHPNRNVRLEGNADERGSNEYNLALGQRRADGVKKMLELGGANANQLDSVSYGEEKPHGTAHNENSWSQNRRTDINYR